MVNSHVMISSFIIDKFRIVPNVGEVYTLDLNRWKISRKGPKGIGTKKGHFNEDAEKKLSDDYETPMGTVVKKIIDNINNGIANELTSDEIRVIFKFTLMLFVRHPDILSKAFKKTEIAQYFIKEIEPSKIVDLLEKTNLYNNLFYDAYPVIIHNHTNISFVSSVSGYSVYSSNVNDKICWYLPIAPNIMLHIVNNEVLEKIYQNNAYSRTDEKNIKFVNEKITETAINNKVQFIFSNDNNELNRLKSKYAPQGNK